MPVTFNSNNNYSVDIITELDIDNPSVIQYSSQTNTPFVAVKITPTNPQTNPVLASNLKFDEQIPDFAWNGSTQQPPACEPPPPPHGTNSSLLHTTGISIPNSCVSQGFTSFFGESNAPQQGPYLLQNSVANRDAQILAFGVGYFEILLVEVYEDDNGNLVNVDFSPATDEQYNHWSMWESPARTGTSGPSITNNVYPVYVKAFIMLQFGTNGLFSNTILNIDIDEVEPIYGCTDPISLDYNSNATIDDGSCTFPIQSYTIQFSDSAMNSTGPYTSNFNAFGIFTRGFVFNGNGTPLVLGNTYSPGDIVNELVTIELTPHSHPTIPNKEIVYDFPIPGGPNPNITQTPGYTNQGDQWGDAKNNLTGTSIRILNMNDQTVTYADAGPFSQWHNSVDPTSFRPRYVTEFGLNPGDGTYTSHIITTDPDGNDLHIPTAGADPLSTFGGVGTVEWYYFDSNPQLNDNPGYEWFPYKIWLSINIKDFVMPAHNVDVVLQIDHNTENQGDPDWVAPGTIYGCTDPSATNFSPGANVDDGSCLYTDDDGEGDDDPLGDA
tara:strand:+ start:1442 stop:3097 length:1656 start_codon:yes stop_codon:yes gene_type:complete